MSENSSDTVISYDDYALDLMEDGSKRGTFRTYTLFIDTHDVTLQHLTIENASGDSATHGQAIALYADGDRLMIDFCRLHAKRSGIRLRFFRLPVHLQKLSCRICLSWQTMARLCKNDPDFL